MPGWEDLRPYQKRMVQWAVEKPYVYLAARPGLGKTAAVLKAIQMWKKRGIANKVLVVAPLLVARDTWPDERNLWAFARGLRMSMVLGSKQQRLAALQQDADIYVINRENIPWLYRQYRPDEWPFDALVYDEASRLKSGRFRTGKTERKDGTTGGRKLSAFAMLCRRRGHFKRLVLMSGTPAPQGLMDWWGPLFLMDGGKRLGPRRDVFMRQYFIQVRQHIWRPLPHAEEAIMGRIRDVVFFLHEDDYLTLPPLVEVPWRVHLPPAALRKYERLARDAVLAEDNIEAVNAAVLSGKLLQLASGCVYDSEGVPVRYHDAKVGAVEEIIRQHEGTPVLVFWQYIPERDALLEAFPNARCYGERDSDLEDWNAGKVPIMLAHPASVAYGLNMQRGGNVMIWTGPTNNLEHYEQGVRRLLRSGQRADRVFSYILVARDTYDEAAVKLLRNKKAFAERMLEAVRVYAEGVRHG